MENSSLDCFEGVPTAGEFLAGFQPHREYILIVPVGFCLMTLWIYVTNLRALFLYGQKETKGNIAALCSIYPIVACSSLVSIIVPKTFFLCDTISHISFVIISYQFYRLCINYVDGESKFIAIQKDETFSFRAPPLCCCCGCLKKSMISKPKFKILRFLVLQFVIVHVIIFVTLNLISIESPETFENVMIFFVPFITATIILGVWGFQITIRMLVPYYANLNLLKKFISFQLVLILCKLQPILIELIMRQFVNDCTGPFTVIIKIRSLTQTAILAEMIVLSLWANNLYTRSQVT